MAETPADYAVNLSPMTDREKRFRTKIDVLWDDVLEAAAGNAKDIRDLTIRVERLSAELPGFIDSVGDKINTNTGHYLAAALKMAEVLKDMSVEINRAADKAAAAAAASAKLDMQLAATNAAKTAISETVGVEVSRMTGQISQAVGNLVAQANAAGQQVQQAARSVSWGVGRVLGLVIVGGLVAGAVTLGGAHYLFKTQTAALAPADPEQAKQIEAGRDFMQLLPQLDKTTRARLIGMIEKNRADAK